MQMMKDHAEILDDALKDSIGYIDRVKYGLSDVAIFGHSPAVDE